MDAVPPYPISISRDGHAVSTSSAEFDDLFARAQAMGLRLTREEYERTRAGVAAFLKAERIPSGTVASPPAPALGSIAAAATNTTNTNSSFSALGVNTANENSSLGEKVHSDTTHSGAPSQMLHQQRKNHTRPLGLSFFTAVRAPEPEPKKPKAKLDDVSSLEEKRRRRHRQRRLMEKMASISEPEVTPRSVASVSPAIAASCSSAAFESASSPRIGLGLHASADTSPSATFLRHESSRRATFLSVFAPRGRSLSATAALSCSADLQAATSDSPGAVDADLQRLSSRAWLSPSGKLKLVSPQGPLATLTAGAHQDIMSPDALDPDDSGIAMFSDSEIQPAPTARLGDGFAGASRAGWGSRQRNDSEGSNSTTAAAGGISEGMAKLGLLERVMKDKCSPRRLRAEAKERAKFTAFEQPGPKAANDAASGPSTVTVARTSTSALASWTGLHPPLQLNEHFRKASHSRNAGHSRQLSQAAKSVRWASNVAASPINHERMTTRDHYEFFVHGIAPGPSNLSEMEVEQDISAAAFAHDAMPWLFSSQDSPAQRKGFFVSDDLTVDLSSIVDGDIEDVSATNLFNPRRGLLFTGPALQQSPVQSKHNNSAVNRFSANFSDVSLSQSPVRPLLAHMASSPAKMGASSASRHQRGCSGNFGNALGRTLFASSPSTARTKAHTGLKQHSLLSGFETISPAALLDNVGHGTDRRLGAVAPAQTVVNATFSQAALPEPTKTWTGHTETDDAADDADEEDSVTNSPIPSRARQATVAKLLLGESGAAQVVKLDHSVPATETDSRPSAAADSSSEDCRHSKVGSKTSKFAGVKSPAHNSAAATSILTGALGLGPITVPATCRKAGTGSGSKAANNISLSDSAQIEKSSSMFAPPGGDASRLEWILEDGSKVVKLISEELQAAMDAGGDFQEPDPRYFVLPPGAGSTKSKPSHVSYAGLIGQAILTSSDHRLSLAEIYQWISTVHPFFERGDRGWQNSIRHNLSLNKSFIKVEREAHIPGKGGWWAIKSGHEERFQNGLYSAGPQKTPDAAEGSSSGKKKKKQQLQAKQFAEDAAVKATTAATAKSTSAAPGEAGPTRTPNPGHIPAVKASKGAFSSRKRHPAGDTESPQTSPSQRSPSRSGPTGASLRKVNKSLKKPKLGAIHSSDGLDFGETSRLPLAAITNRKPPSYSQGTVFDSVTPSRSDRAPFLASSTHGGSQSGVPMLTDSASSPPSSPPPMSDAMMPPPSSLGPSSVKRSKGPVGVNGFVNFGQDAMYAASMMGYGVENGGGAGGHFFGSGTGLYPPQPSPLANRLCGVTAGGASRGSPLRRQTIPANAPGSPTKVAAPVSSMREMSGLEISSASSLAGALRGRSGSTTHAERGGSAQHGPFTNFLTNPFAVARGSPAGGARSARSNAEGNSHMRGSPMKMCSPVHFSPNVASMMSPAGGQLQMAMHSNGVNTAGLLLDFGQAGASCSAIGMGFGSSNLTPVRGTPGKGSFGTNMIGVSPSPTMRRFQQQQAGNGWLDDPFDYQGALQHELETMGTGSAAMMSGVEQGMNAMANGAPQAGHCHEVRHSGSTSNSGGLLAMSGMVPGGWGMMGISPVRSGSIGWLGAQDNVSAVRTGRANSDDAATGSGGSTRKG